jgi:hypothetical protein
MPLPRRPIVLALSLLAAGCGSDSEPGAPQAPEGVQAAGTYTYRTAGAEQIGGPLPGRHRYGPRSTIAVDVSGCELSERWEASPQRWAEWRYCVTRDTWRLRSVTDHHEFFGRTEEYSYRCSGRRVPRPAQIKERFRWTDRCRTRGIAAVARGEVVSIAPLHVRGSTVAAVHLRVRTAFSGRVRGGYVLDSWLRRADGLLLRRDFDSRTRVRSVIGTVADRERYRLDIVALTPDE